MANMLFANNCNTTLSSSLTNVATTMSVTSATGFPAPTGSQYFYCTLADAATQTTIEIVKVTAVSGTTFTIVRGQDGTTGTIFASGAVVSLRLVRANLTDFALLDEANTFTGANAYGTPASIVLTNASGTASININGTVGATTASTGAFTTLSASSTVSGTGFSTYLASPPAIGGTAAASGKFTTLAATGVFTASAGTAALPSIVTSSGSTSGFYSSTANVLGVAISATSIGTFTSTGLNGMAVGATTASTGAFTTLSASSTVSGTGFSTYLASPPAIGGTAAAAVTGSNLMSSGGVWAKGLYAGTTYTDGMVIDYVSPTARFSAGTSDGFAWYNGGVGTTALMTLSSAGALATISSATATAFIPSSATVPTNGMFLSAANTVGFATNSAQAMQISSTGGVSIGNTTDPGAGGLRITGSYINSGAPASTYHLDTQTNITLYTTGSTVNFSNFSGMLIVNSTSNGDVSCYITGGGIVTKLGSTAGAIGTVVYNSAVNGVTWTNTTAGSVAVGFAIIRTRAGQ